MSGIGLIIIITQLLPLIGLTSPGTPLSSLLAAGSAIGNVNLQALFFALGTIAAIYLLPKITKVILGTLVAQVFFTLYRFVKTSGTYHRRYTTRVARTAF